VLDHKYRVTKSSRIV